MINKLCCLINGAGPCTKCAKLIACSVCLFSEQEVRACQSCFKVICPLCYWNDTVVQDCCDTSKQRSKDYGRTPGRGIARWTQIVYAKTKA